MSSMRAALISLLVTSSLLITANGLSCVCPEPDKCPEVQCPDGVEKIWDVCGCCEECARTEGEYCGGLWGGGECNKGLKCALPIDRLHDRYHDGTCQDESTIHQCQLDFDGALCGYKGVCRPVGDDYDCNCYWPQYTGKNCDQLIPDPCGNQPCQNDGHCISDLGSSEFLCLCNPGTEGKFCEIILPDPCDSNPCQNGGECFSALGLPEAHCLCFPEYEGHFCETPVPDPCDSNPCRNEGVCLSNLGSPEAHCFCPPEYDGQFCESPVLDPCLCDPCLNGGECASKIGSRGIICLCPRPFYGELCQMEGRKEELCNEELVGDKDAGYRGCQVVTRSGKTCQAWDNQMPHSHSRTVDNYPDSGLESNYCRNPDGEDTIWCYTMDADARWEYCDPVA